jgi:hypothetical protein
VGGGSSRDGVLSLGSFSTNCSKKLAKSDSDSSVVYEGEDEEKRKVLYPVFLID